MKIILLILMSIMVLIPLSDAFAESKYDINIPSGSADKNAPFHWISEKDGDASGFIKIMVEDTVFWKNADTVSHTVTSGTPENGFDGIFDSGMIEPGKFFTKKFTTLGNYDYFCSIHPWRTGVVSVISGFSILSDVGRDAGDGMTVFDVEYKFNRIINNIQIVEESKAILLELKGNTNSDDNTLTLLLPVDLINGINSVSIDGEKIEAFSQEFGNDMIKLEIQDVHPKAKRIVITGTTIVPEFSEIVFFILTISVVGIIGISRKSHVLRTTKFLFSK